MRAPRRVRNFSLTLFLGFFALSGLATPAVPNTPDNADRISPEVSADTIMRPLPRQVAPFPPLVTMSSRSLPGELADHPGLPPLPEISADVRTPPDLKDAAFPAPGPVAMAHPPRPASRPDGPDPVGNEADGIQSVFGSADIPAMKDVWYGDTIVHPSRLSAWVREAADLAQTPPTTLRDASGLACLAVTIYHEARNQPRLGREAVAAVILRRASVDGRWGKTICDVTIPVQFSYLSGSLGFAPIREQEPWVAALELSIDILSRGPKDYLSRADHYHTLSVDPSWNSRMKVVAVIDDHIFYADTPPSR